MKFPIPQKFADRPFKTALYLGGALVLVVFLVVVLLYVGKDIFGSEWLAGTIDAKLGIEAPLP